MPEDRTPLSYVTGGVAATTMWLRGLIPLWVSSTSLKTLDYHVTSHCCCSNSPNLFRTWVWWVCKEHYQPEVHSYHKNLHFFVNHIITQRIGKVHWKEMLSKTYSANITDFSIITAHAAENFLDLEILPSLKYIPSYSSWKHRRVIADLIAYVTWSQIDKITELSCKCFIT